MDILNTAMAIEKSTTLWGLPENRSPLQTTAGLPGKSQDTPQNTVGLAGKPQNNSACVFFVFTFVK